MFRVDHASAAASMPAPSPANNPGYFTEGNEAGGVPATVVTADWSNMIQEELLNVVQAGGQTPAKGAFNQLLLAIQSLISQGQTSGVAQVSFFAVKTPPVGHLKCDGKTIGKPGSGATARANNDVLLLFKALWQDWSNTILPIQTASGTPTVRGTSAQADWDALKRLPLPELRGEGLRAWDDGRGVDASREFGSGQLGAVEGHTHSGSSASAGGHAHGASSAAAGGHTHTATTGGDSHAHTFSAITSSGGAHTHTFTAAVQTGGDGYDGGKIANSGTGTTSSAGAHTHTVDGSTAAASHSHTVTIGAASNHSHAVTVDEAGAHNHTVNIGATGGAETRMRNIALSAFIRYL